MNRATRKRVQRLLEEAERELEREPGEDLASVASRVDLRQYALTLALLSAGEPGPEMARALSRELREATVQAHQDGLELVTPEGRARVACKAECTWCCREPLQVSPLDALGVADHLLAQRDRWMLRLATYELPDRRSAQLKKITTPCPFLGDNKLCQVYEARPVVCRAFHSTDVSVCRLRVERADGNRTVPMHLEWYGFTGLPLEGAHRALDEAAVERRPVVLGPAVALLLSDFAGVTTRWLAGEPVWGDVAVL